MLKLYYAPLTRAVRVLWLLEELGLRYELERVEFKPTATTFFQQQTPLGKLPTLEDGDVVMCESGAILEYLLERYGEGRLAPAVGAPERAGYLQWLHFAESTAFAPLGIVVWLSRYRGEAERHAELIEDARGRAASGLAFVEQALGDGRPYLVGADFTAADIMMGFTLGAARALGVLDPRFPALTRYFARLAARPAFQTALSGQAA
jgi:glutathione S-transferase